MVVPARRPPTAALALQDGTVFLGFGVGSPGVREGELVFNTAMTGYEEILTDPSYAGQIVTFTFPHIGNVGTNPEDVEAITPVARGMVVRTPVTEPANWRSTDHLAVWLERHGIAAITGVDTRRITRILRERGAQNAALAYAPDGKLDLEDLKRRGQGVARPRRHGPGTRGQRAGSATAGARACGTSARATPREAATVRTSSPSTTA